MNTPQPPGMPQHQNPSPQRTASAPYNFVPLSEVVVKAVERAEDLPDQDCFDPNRHTGYFEVVLTTRSPLYVRCPLTLEQFERQEAGQYADGAPLPLAGNSEFRRLVKNLPHFFYTRQPDQPVIPGSSLRGMLRNLVEIVSYSKVSRVTDKQLFFRTVDNTAVGQYYNRRLVAGAGTKADGYRTLTEGGFWRIQQDGSPRIEQAVVARVEMSDVAAAFGLSDSDALYQGAGPNATPRWNYQSRPVWVQIDATPRSHAHSKGKFLHYLRVTGIKSAPAAGHTEGTLVLTGPMHSKHMAFVFLKQDNPVWFDVPANGEVRLADRFHDDDQITRWQVQAFPRGQPPGAQRERDGYLRDGEPVFFLTDDGNTLVFFGRAQMFRLPYRNRPLDLVPPHLRQPEDIDYAEALFGFVRTRAELRDLKERDLPVPKAGSKGRAYAGRVFVTDATLDGAQDNVWLSPHPFEPQVLATPKPTTFQHYLVQTTEDPTALKHYDSPSPHETVLRGHKLYWHQGNRSLENLRPEPGSPNVQRNGQVEAGSTQHTQFKPVRSEVRFRFRVFFENLSPAELGALCWVLQPLGEPTRDYCHSLGMGKPFGMGAVKLEATLHLSNRETRYGSLFADDAFQEGYPVAGAKLADRATLEKFTAPFEQHVLGLLKPAPGCSYLSGLRRIGILLKLLEWPGFPPVLPATPANRHVQGQNRPNTRYMTVRLPGVPAKQCNEYRSRPVLPDPSAFGGLTGSSVPQAAPPAPPPSPGGTSPGVQPPKRQASAPTASIVSPPAGKKSSAPPPGPKIKPINKGEREGILQRKDSRWVAVFASPTGDREGVVINPDKIPDVADGSRALFYIDEANKHRIRARFERLSK